MAATLCVTSAKGAYGALTFQRFNHQEDKDRNATPAPALPPRGLRHNLATGLVAGGAGQKSVLRFFVRPRDHNKVRKR